MIGVGVYQFFFKKKEVVDFIITNGPWNVEDHMLILAPWSEHPLNEATVFAKVDFWVWVMGFPFEWYLS